VPKTNRLIEMTRLIHIVPGRLTAKELARNFGVSERGIFRYIETLKASGVEVEFDFEKGGYTLMNDVLNPEHRFYELVRTKKSRKITPFKTGGATR
jgi:predicted DNA-binding transcriptional regulator YafY